MTKKPKPVSVGDPGDDAPKPDNRSPLEREAEAQEQKLVSLMQSEQVNGGTIVLKRRAVNETEFGYLGEMPVENFTLDNVRKIYGGGDYKAQVKKAGGTFVTSFAFKIDFRIPSLYPGVTDRPKDSLLDRTPEIITAVTAAVRQSIPAAAPAQDNSLTLELIRQQGNMVAALMAKPAAGPDPALIAILSEMRAELRELKSGGNRGENFLKEIEKFKALSELFNVGGGGGDAPDKPDRVTELIRALAPAVAPFVQKLMAGGADPAQLAGQPAPIALNQARDPAAASGPAATTETDPNMNPLFNIYLAQFRKLAIQAASKNRNAFEWADSKIDDIEPKYHADIFKMANAEDWFAKFFAGDPAANAHIKWLLDMRNAILTRAFLASVKSNAAAQPRPEPAALAASFVNSVSVSYHDALWDLLDPEAWKELFSHEELDAVWLEKLRVGLEHELGTDDESTASAAAAPASAPAAAISEVKPKRPAKPRSQHAEKTAK